MNYSKLINNLTAEMKKGVQYARMPLVVKIFMIVALFPVIVSFVVTKLIYWITLFFYKMISSPAEYLHEWVKKQKDEVQHATQAVLYWICMPFVFGLQLLLSFSSLVFFFLWFVLMVQGYLLTLGGIKWQPFITEVTFDDEGEYECKPDLKIAAIFAYTTAGVLLFCILLASVSDIILDLLRDGGANLWKFYKALGTTETIATRIYLILACIVNPILFKRVSKD